MGEFELIDIIEVGNSLGECILWDERTQSVCWLDIHGARWFRYFPATRQLRKYDLPERAGSFGLVEDDERLIVAFASGFALYDPQSATCEWLYRPEAGFTGTRFNDGRCDARGRFWAGTMVEAETATDANGKPTLGSLYWVAGKQHSKVLTDIRIANSLCWSADGRTVYFADSPTAHIRAFDFDAATATFTNSRVFATTPAGSVPDGATVDAEGHVWNAHWGGGRVVRYAPDGHEQCRLELPVTQPTCVCLGGVQFDTLFVTTARVELDHDQLRAQPLAGHVLVYKTRFRGLPEARYKTA